MILQTVIELIQEEYPKYGESYLKTLINAEYKKYCHKTQMVKGIISLSSGDSRYGFVCFHNFKYPATGNACFFLFHDDIHSYERSFYCN